MTVCELHEQLLVMFLVKIVELDDAVASSINEEEEEFYKFG